MAKDRKTPSPAKESRPRFPVVGIGGSAGALKSLLEFFEAMPADNGMAFVVILHLSPKHSSSLHTILGNVTRMPVTPVAKTTIIEANHVYVIAPTTHLEMVDGTLHVTRQPERAPRPVAVDLFFRTLAGAHRERAFGIVMSGTGSDGSVGISRLKEEGGVVFAQSPDQAEFSAMPESAIQTGMVDFVLDSGDMPAKLVALADNARNIKLPRTDQVIAQIDESIAAEDALRGILALLRARSGHDFNHYKRATVVRRIERRLQVNAISNLPDYLAFLRDHPSETPPLMSDMLIGVTNFFRDREAYEALEKQAIPALFHDKDAEEEVRVWIAGCSTGEEAYSIAILLAEAADAIGKGHVLRVFATDIDADAVARARLGVYPESIAADVPSVRLAAFFTKEPSGYRVSRRIRQIVMFADHDLIRDPPFSRMDLISCRNVLIYLNREVQRHVLELFRFALMPGGWLFLGSAESVDGGSDIFEVQDKRHSLATAKAFRGDRKRLPSLPAGVQPSGRSQARQSGARSERVILGELHQRALEQYAPPSVIVDPHHEILHLSERAGAFMQMSGGEASLNIVKMSLPELRADLRALLFQAGQTGANAHARSVVFHREDGAHTVDLHVRPIPSEGLEGQVMLILFDERESVSEGSRSERRQAPLAAALETDIERAREQLHATIEQYETQNEELTASNEELQALNEELRSTSEELETSKEELQSINEELVTVNQELKNKVDEGTRINDDLHNLIASIDMGVIFLDRNLNIKRYSDRAPELFSLRPFDTGRPLLDIAHRLEYGELAEDTRHVFERLSVQEREVRSTDGRWFATRLAPYRTADDKIDGAVLTFHEITARKSIEARLQRSELRARMLLDGIKDYAIMTFGEDFAITDWSRGAERIFGWSRDEIVGESAELIFLPEDRERGVPQDEMRRARVSGSSEDERWHVRKDGSRFYASGVMAHLVEGGEFYVKIARDLTERREAESERETLLARERSMRTEVEKASLLKDEFLATLSHELRNPLNLISLQAELILRSGKSDPQLKRAAQLIRQTVDTQSQLISDLLDTSRLQTGKFTLHPQLLPLTFVVADCLGAIRQEAMSKQVSIEVDLTPEPLIVDADPVRVRQIAWNLLSNAVKFTGARGKIAVKLTREGDEARLEVADNGAGIAPDVLPRIYDMFSQGEVGTTREHGGLGIGLALVKQMVEIHSGRIEAHSEGIGKGARFTVWLPLHKAAPFPQVVTAPKGLPHAASAAGKPALDAVSTADIEGQLVGLRLLVIDDTAENAESLRALLLLEGADVRIAASAREALIMLGEFPFDLVVSDIAMPEMDGNAFIAELRKASRNARTPAIALSGYDRPRDAAKARESGFDEHIAKPADIDKLVKMIRKLTGSGKARAKHRPAVPS